MIRFLTLLISLSLGVYCYLLARLVLCCPIAHVAKVGLAVGLLLPFGFMIGVPLILWNIPRKTRSLLQTRIMHWSYLIAGGVSVLLLATVFRDLFLLVFLAIPKTRGLPFRSALAGGPGAAGTVIASIGIWLGGWFEANRTPRIRRVRVPVVDLHPDLEGFQIAQVSDLHIGPSVQRAFVEQVVECVNGLSPDLIALTGDLVDGYVADLVEDIAPLQKLSAKRGVFYVTGNHEYYWDGAGWLSHLEQLGVRTLPDTFQLLRHGNARLLVAGLNDPTSYGRGNRLSAMRDLIQWEKTFPDSDFRLLLAHQPKIARKASGAGFHLQLSGHTHGGQFLPWTFVIYLFHEFVHGLNRLDAMWVYVSRGTGYWGPPLRIGAPSEITLLTLVRTD